MRPFGMAKKSTAPKRNLAQIAFAVAEMAIGEAPLAAQEPSGVAPARTGKTKSGKARAKPLTKAQRADLARIEAIVRKKSSR
jgi:hypothetical protein